MTQTKRSSWRRPNRSLRCCLRCRHSSLQGPRCSLLGPRLTSLLLGTLPLLFMFAPIFDLRGDEPPKSVALFDGKSLKGWSTPKKFEFEKHGEVKIVNREIHMGVGKPATGVVCTAKLPRDNYELSLEAKRVAGGDFFCGVTFPVGKEYCSLIVGGWGGGVIGFSNVDGMSAIENETTGYQAFKNDKWYQVRIRVTPENVSAWVDKKHVVDLQREGRKFSIWWEQEPMRPLGFANWNTASALRNIRFRDLDPQRTKKQERESKPADRVAPEDSKKPPAKAKSSG